ncbi:MAG: FeS assembly protein SufD [Microgenomates group bacterium GW2011_GWF2_45_18]|nr:MAG: FeS assembly protein SufD [Microgenomates group bacterium GW2011_GWF1_44_10]KKU02140.1 MAG: FeS assembly protein SufD [Microgenomates group bacterium GW2011_GWF2_45_18]OGJ41781.1 MAG: hypothetical protein A2378_00685 [Candidatus Pacebacteria bacterium RIFOXYB1_FULL_44_10]HAU98690.1 hypothetical protein [Candidatus Paceibacterota bacterium]HAX01884.1 hypothetical protein [Candidatus Paceibacterota bacterium]
MKQIDISNQLEPVNITLSSESEQIEVVGSFLVAHGEKKEVVVTIVHAVPHTSAKITLRGVVFGGGYLSIRGKILVEKNAFHTDSFLKEEILLCDETAKAEAIPNLEIQSDDVKCSHASSISLVSSQHLHFLQSRGIAKDVALNLLIQGFLHTPQEKTA